MSKKNIRSEYIKNLMAEKENIGKVFEENTRKAIKDILAESLPDGIKKLIAEAEEDKKENEQPVVEEVGQEPEIEVVDAEAETPEMETEPADAEPAEDTDAKEEEAEEQREEDAEIQEPESADEEDDTLAEIEDLKGEDGEYDLTGMSDEDFIKVMKVVKPEDGVRVVRDCDDNTITITDDNNDTEYVIELDDVCEEECGKIAESKSMMRKPVGMGFGSKRELEKPYDKKACIKEEEDIFEIELDDVDENPIELDDVDVPESEVEGKHYGKALPQQKSASKRNGYDKRGLSQKMKNEGVERRISEIMEENKQLRKIASQIKDQLNEEAVINGSLANIVKLIVENTTSRDEKIDIIKRFDSVKSLQESKALYESISKELGKEVSSNTAKAKMNANLNEAVEKNANMVKTALYESEDLSRTKDLMKRMIEIGRK